ncbi:hypothetical protein KEM55_007383, partial [Ascosphaera atra]
SWKGMKSSASSASSLLPVPFSLPGPKSMKKAVLSSLALGSARFAIFSLIVASSTSQYSIMGPSNLARG